jgi:hypothetical protein
MSTSNDEKIRQGIAFMSLQGVRPYDEELQLPSTFAAIGNKIDEVIITSLIHKHISLGDICERLIEQRTIDQSHWNEAENWISKYYLFEGNDGRFQQTWRSIFFIIDLDKSIDIGAGNRLQVSEIVQTLRQSDSNLDHKLERTKPTGKDLRLLTAMYMDPDDFTTKMRLQCHSVQTDALLANIKSAAFFHDVERAAVAAFSARGYPLPTDWKISTRSNN